MFRGALLFLMPCLAVACATPTAADASEDSATGNDLVDDAAIADGPTAEDSVDAGDALDTGHGATPCLANGIAGTCLDVGACSPPFTSVPGHCPGPVNIQCCIRAADASTDASVVDWDALAIGCPSDMVSLPGYCMDRYEAPNVAGAAPLAFQTAIDGQAWCAARGKRLCTEAEWVTACQGARGDNYPYGGSYVPHICNDDATWIAPDWALLATYPSDASIAEAQRLYQADPSGARTGCRSEEGVMDMTGNVAEWVVRSYPNANNYDHVMKGCYWSGCFGGTPPNCSFVNPAHPGTFRTYEAGFRCCVTP